MHRLYHGPQVLLHDGTRVSPGACILELHLANTRLPHSNGEPVAGQAYLWQLSGELKRDLKALATAARARQLPDFVALYGVTSMGPGARHLGFELLAAPDHLATSLVAWWQRVLKRVFHPAGRYRHREKRRRPLIAWMSWVTLLGVYGDRASRKCGML